MRTYARKALLGGCILAAVVSVAPLAGCGGGMKRDNGGAVSRGARGTVQFSVAWPETTRVIPLAARSIRVTLTRTPATVGPVPTQVTQVIARPQTTVTFPGLELGAYTVDIRAYSSTDATGTPVAVGGATVNVVADNNPALNVTINATITNLAIAPQTNAPLRVGDTRQYTITATDAAGSIVLVDPAALQWSTSNPAFATVTQTGLLTAIGFDPTTNVGPVVVTVRYVEPGTPAGAQGTGATVTANALVVKTGLSTSAWPKFHGNLQNTGVAVGGPAILNNPKNAGPGWPATAGGSVVFSSPAVAPDGTVYVGAYDNNLYAFRPDGTLKWRFATRGVIESSPLISVDGTIYFGSLDGNMYALRDDGTSAAVVWTFAAGGPVFGSPTIDNAGYLYFGATNPDTRVYKLDALNGNKVWEFAASGGIEGAPALNAAQDTVYLASNDGNVYAIRTNTGGQRWVYATNSAIVASSPAIGQAGGSEVLYIGTLDGTVYALNAATGGTQWTIESALLDGQVYTTPAFANGRVYVATFDNTSGTNNNAVYALDAATGAIVWQTPAFADGFTSSPAVSADGTRVYIGNYNGSVYGLQATNGAVAWQFTTPPAATQSEFFDSSICVGADGTLYIGGFTGNVYAITR